MNQKPTTGLFSGPGVVVTGAFIGPGTVTLCLLAGVNSGVSLLWAVLFSTFATIILQDMVVRLAIYRRQSLETIILQQFSRMWIKALFALFIFSAIIVGNTAYQSGNLAGTSLGLNMIFDSWSNSWVVFVIASLCIIVFALNDTTRLKSMLGFLVMLMSLTFMGLAAYFMPGAGEMARGLFIPTLQDGQLMLALGLVGTTVVPYNLFLHSSLVCQASTEELTHLRREGAFSIFIGGLISMAIVITGNLGKGTSITNAAEMAAMLKNTMGSSALWLFGTGLFAAGLSSALTAPMAAGRVASGLWKHFFVSHKGVGFWTEVAVVVLGAGVAIANVNNLWVIKTAQVINGLLLPVFIMIILWLLNSRANMKMHRNHLWLNLAGLFVLVVSVLLAFKTITSVLG